MQFDALIILPYVSIFVYSNTPNHCAFATFSQVHFQHMLLMHSVNCTLARTINLTNVKIQLHDYFCSIIRREFRSTLFAYATSWHYCVENEAILVSICFCYEIGLWLICKFRKYGSMQAIEWGSIALEVCFECLQWQQVERAMKCRKNMSIYVNR